MFIGFQDFGVQLPINECHKKDDSCFCSFEMHRTHWNCTKISGNFADFAVGTELHLASASLELNQEMQGKKVEYFRVLVFCFGAISVLC